MSRTQAISAVSAVASLGASGNIWLLVQEARGRIRTRGWNTRLLRGLSVLSAAIVVGTAVFARPWYWDLALAAVAVVGVVSVSVLLQALWLPVPQTVGRVVALSGGAVMIGIALLGLAGVAFVLDLASLGSAEPAPLYHGGEILETPILYQLFWGPGWEHPSQPAVEQAVAFQKTLADSAWAREISKSNLGIGHFSNGGCWIDPTPAPPGTSVRTTQSAPFANELRAVFGHAKRGAVQCPGTQSPVPASLPADALVALWLPGNVARDHGNSPPLITEIPHP